MDFRRLVVASLNQNKIGEIRALTASLPLQVVSLRDLCGYPLVEEDGATFLENARKKAVAIARFTQYPALADDSGLEVEALKGAPGVHSARYAGEPTSDQRNNEKLLRKLAGLEWEKRRARFRTVMALAFPDGEVKFSAGSCSGFISFQPQGSGGFGYDPIFFLPEYGKTFAELGAGVKNKISHRARAMQKMEVILKSLLNAKGDYP